MSHGGGHGGWFAHKWHEWTDFEEWVDWVGEWGVSRALFLGTLFFGQYFVLSQFIPNLGLFTFSWLAGTAPIWVPIGLVVGGWKAWIWYAQSLYLSGRSPMLLEVKFPREITKSPRAMELALLAFNLSSGETTFIHRAWKGQVRPFFSLELASFGGEVHFFIWTWKNYKDVVESALYTQYPEIEIVQVEDYATKFQYDPEKHTAWGVEWPMLTSMAGFKGKGMHDFRINAYQLRSYVDYELDKDPKEEFKIDPLAYILEFLSSINPNEQLWIQIVFRKAGRHSVLGIFSEPDDDSRWKSVVEKEVQRIRAQASIIPSSVLSDVYSEAGEEDTGKQPQARASWRQQRMMESMERHLGKTPYEVGMRGIYWVEGDLRGTTSTGLRWIWRPYGNPFYGSYLRPKKWHCDFDYPWQDFHDLRWINQTRRVHDAYRRRSYFHSPWIVPTNIMTNETLASLWHPPSRAVTAPGLARMPATKSEAPANLPM
ncbi:MAG TPA: hypothetical protein VHD38_00155 [Candidatus Paceibacterota bacterium]|nr:hypothetical protein [Candidatus Paceibacterota bacterium]